MIKQTLRSIGLRVIFTLFVLLATVSAFAQSATTQTTLSTALITPTATTPPTNSVTLASGTGVIVGSWLVIDSELMQVTGIGGTPTFTVNRSGQGGTSVTTHAAGAIVWMVLPSASQTLTTVDPSGSCTASNYQYLPLINAATGTAWYCNAINGAASEWGGYDNAPHYSPKQVFTAVASASATAQNAYTVKVTDSIVVLTTTGTGSGALAAASSTWTLPSHLGLQGKVLILKDGSGGITGTTFIALSGTIDNVPTTTLGVYLKTAYGGVQLVAGSGGWFTISCYRSLLCQ